MAIQTTNDQHLLNKNYKNSKRNNESRSNRIIQRMQAFGLFKKDATGAIYERATTCRELEQAFRLVHDVYVDAGYIRPQKHGIRMRHFECSPSTATFVAQTASHSTIGVMSVVMDSDDFGLPSDHVYKTEIDALRSNGAIICEFSNQAVLKEFRKKGPSTELMRCAFAHAFAMGVTDIVFSVSPNVVSFYKTMHFQRFGTTKNYSSTLDDPVVLIHVPNIQTRGIESVQSDDPAYRFFMRFFYQDNPYTDRFHSWEILSQRMFNDQFEFATLLCKCPELVQDKTHEKGLRKRLGSIYTIAQDAVALSSDDRASTQNEVHTKRQLQPPFRTIPYQHKRFKSEIGQRRSFAPVTNPQDNGSSIESNTIEQTSSLHATNHISGIING